MSEQHTPGPWLLELKEGIGGQVSLFVTSRGKEVAAVYGRDNDVRMMLAAPDMLAALQQAEIWLDAVTARGPAMEAAYQQVCAAIAKATWQPPNAPPDLAGDAAEQTRTTPN